MTRLVSQTSRTYLLNGIYVGHKWRYPAQFNTAKMTLANLGRSPC